MKNHCLFLLLCLSVICFATIANSAESGSQQNSLRFVAEEAAVIKTPTFTSEGWHWGKRIAVDKKFAEKFHTQIPPASFSLVYPNDSSVRVLPGKGSKSPWFIMFGFFEKNETDFTKRPLEILRFTEVHVKMTDPKERVKQLAALMKSELPRALAKDWPQGKPVELYQTKIGSYDAVTLLVIVKDPEKGAFWARYTGVLNPDSKYGVLALAMIDIEKSGLKSVEELHQRGESLRVIHTVKFLAPDQGEKEDGRE